MDILLGHHAQGNSHMIKDCMVPLSGGPWSPNSQRQEVGRWTAQPGEGVDEKFLRQWWGQPQKCVNDLHTAKVDAEKLLNA